MMRTTPFIWIAITLAVLLLAACAASPAPERAIENTRTVTAPPGEIAPRIVDFLERRGIEDVRVASDQSSIDAARPSFEDDWARCRDVHVSDSEGERRREADLVDRRLDVEVSLERLSGRTRVAVRPAFVRTMRNSFTNTTFEARCTSTGRLERALLGAI